MKEFDCLHALKALAEESRLRILRRLMKRPATVNELAGDLASTAYNTSKHLRVLREAGLVVCERKGQQRIYSLAEDFAEHLDQHENVLDLGCCQFDFSMLPE